MVVPTPDTPEGERRRGPPPPPPLPPPRRRRRRSRARCASCKPSARAPITRSSCSGGALVAAGAQAADDGAHAAAARARGRPPRCWRRARAALRQLPAAAPHCAAAAGHRRVLALPLVLRPRARAIVPGGAAGAADDVQLPSHHGGSEPVYAAHAVIVITSCRDSVPKIVTQPSCARRATPRRRCRCRPAPRRGRRAPSAATRRAEGPSAPRRSP